MMGPVPVCGDSHTEGRTLLRPADTAAACGSDHRMISRRRFITAASATILLVVPHGLTAQPSTALPRIGLLGDTTSWDAFRLGLRDLGYVGGTSIAIEERSSQGRNERFQELASDLVRRNVKV